MTRARGGPGGGQLVEVLAVLDEESSARGSGVKGGNGCSTEADEALPPETHAALCAAAAAGFAALDLPAAADVLSALARRGGGRALPEALLLRLLRRMATGARAELTSRVLCALLAAIAAGAEEGDGAGDESWRATEARGGTSMRHELAEALAARLGDQVPCRPPPRALRAAAAAAGALCLGGRRPPVLSCQPHQGGSECTVGTRVGATVGGGGGSPPGARVLCACFLRCAL